MLAHVKKSALALLLLMLAPVSARAEEVLVGAAVSLKEPLEAIAKRFEAEHTGSRVQLAFGASNALAAQAKAGAPMDVLVSADEQSVDAVAAAGLVHAGRRALIAGNRLVVVVMPGLAIPVTGPDDLKRPELRHVAIGGPGVPAGEYAREWLGKAGLLDALTPRLVTTEHVRTALAAVDTGNAEAAIVYATDARAAKSAKLAFAVPAAEHPRIVYAAALLGGPRAKPLAAAFFEALRGPEARRSLEAAGFLGPPAAEPAH
jgi:molybdate transport system substrate-binding protein